MSKFADLTPSLIASMISSIEVTGLHIFLHLQRWLFIGFITYYTTICGFIKWWPFGQQIRKEAQKPPFVFIC